MKKAIWFATIAALMAAPILWAAETAKEPEKETGPGVRLTVYNGGFALVKDVREMDVPKKGLNVIRFRDVASAIDATSVHFTSLTDPAATILEQNYEYDLVGAAKLLDKYIAKEIAVLTKDGKEHRGTLLSFDGRQLVLRQGGEKGGLSMIERGENIKTIQFSKLPEGLLTRPTLVWMLESAKPGKQLVKVAYQTRNMNWRADYTVIAAPDDRSVDVSGWVTITNNSGTAYKDARIKLLAGDVAEGRRERPYHGWGPEYFKGVSKLPPTTEKGKDPGEVFGEYHLYRLPEPSTVNNNQVKQIELLNAPKVTCEKVYIYDGAKVQWYPGRMYWDANWGKEENKKVNVLIEIENRADRGLGIALPKGKVRVYKRDTDKSLEFIGEDLIDHTARDEKLVLYVGDAFDIVGERTQTDYSVNSGQKWATESFKITLRNHKEEDVTVKVIEKLYRCVNWEVTKQSHDFVKLDSRTIQFPVKVPKDGETVVTYTVRYWWH